jgi:hypothetical protein
MPIDIKKQLEDMEELITANTVAPSTESVATNAPGTDAPGTDSPSTTAPGTDNPSTDVPGTDAPATEAPTTDAPEDDKYAELIRRNQELEERLNKLEKPKTEAPSTEAPSTATPVSDEDFLNGIDLDEMTRDPAVFNKVLNSVLKKGIEIGRGESVKSSERILKSIPEIVKTNVSMVQSLKKMNDDFYSANEDLKPFKKVVALTFEEIASKHPEKSYKDILEIVGKEARNKLELHIKAQGKDKTSPRLPRPKGRPNRQPKQKPNTDPMLDELDAMDKELGF